MRIRKKRCTRQHPVYYGEGRGARIKCRRYPSFLYEQCNDTGGA
jgi:hypothetical protein